MQDDLENSDDPFFRCKCLLGTWKKARFSEFIIVMMIDQPVISYFVFWWRRRRDEERWVCLCHRHQGDGEAQHGPCRPGDDWRETTSCRRETHTMQWSRDCEHVRQVKSWSCYYYFSLHYSVILICSRDRKNIMHWYGGLSSRQAFAGWWSLLMRGG